MTDLKYVPLSEFQRLRESNIDPVEYATAFALLCRINTLYMIKRAGSGHIGSSFSAMDIVCWLYLNEISDPRDRDLDQNIYYSSKGHDAPGLYSVLIGLGYLDFDLLHKLRRLDGLPGHPDVETPCMVTNTGSLGMGVSKAKGFAHARRLLNKTGFTYVLTGDGELQEGQFWESLPSAANQNMGGIVAIVDHNKIQSDTWVKDVNDLGDLEAKFKAYGWHVSRCDGNDIERFSKLIEELKTVTDRPKVIIADTIKGKGVSFMEHPSMAADGWYRYHSGAPADEDYSKALDELSEKLAALCSELGLQQVELENFSYTAPQAATGGNEQRLVNAYSKALLSQAEKNKNLVVLDADLVLDCGLIPFMEKYPERYIECGIAEQDMVSQAGALALSGMMPIAHSFACFLSTRPNEQIYNNASERTKTMYVGSLAGLLPGVPGHSHQSVRDISILASVPGLVLVQPCNENEVGMAVDYCLNQTGNSTYLRLVSIPCQVPFSLPAGYQLEEGKGAVVREGENAVIFAYGPVMLGEAYKAAELLQEQSGFSLKVVNLPWLNRLDSEWLATALAGVKNVYTLDDHYLVGGQGDMLLSKMTETGLAKDRQCRKFGVADIPLCGLADEVLRAHGLDAASLAKVIKDTSM
jgi:transketolase